MLTEPFMVITHGVENFHFVMSFFLNDRITDSVLPFWVFQTFQIITKI